TVYTDWIRNGGVLVAVNAESRRADQAAKIMEGYADEEITTKVRTAERELKRAPLQAATEATSDIRSRDNLRDLRARDLSARELTARDLGQRDLNAREPKEIGSELKEEEATIPVVQEELRVGKRKVQRAPVRVSRHVSEMPVEETVQLCDETVTVERHT